MTDFTPGPWGVMHSAQNRRIYVKADGGSGIEVIAERLMPEAGTPIEARVEANARLIAAAPDLLAALEAVLQDCDRVVCPLCGEARGHSLGAGCDLAT